MRQGPAYGEDTAAIDVGGETLVVNSDPLSLATDRVGTLAVHVACNDVAASGAAPRWLTNAMFLPNDDPSTLATITNQLDGAARKLDAAIVGGHAEYLPALDRPLLSLTAFGLTERYVPTGGARSGDRVLLYGTAGIEGTAILATDFREELRERGLDAATIDRAETVLEDLSVVPEALAAREYATAMHDPTEVGCWPGSSNLRRRATSGSRPPGKRSRSALRHASWLTSWTSISCACSARARCS